MEAETSTTTNTGGGREGAGRRTGGGGPTERRESGGGGRASKRDPVVGGLRERDPVDWHEVSWKSVSLAKQEQGHRKSRAKGETQAVCLVGNGDPKKDGGGAGVSADDTDGGGEGAKERKSRSLQETESSTMRQHARKREEEFLARGAQNFYKPVRVCGSCFRVSASAGVGKGGGARRGKTHVPGRCL